MTIATLTETETATSDTTSAAVPARHERWNDFVAASPYADILQCLEWGEVKRGDWKPLPLSLETDGQLEAVALVLKRKLPRTSRSILYVPRGPILDWSRPDLAAAVVKKLRALARRERAILIKIDPAVPASTPGVSATLQRLGFVPSPDAAIGTVGGTQPRFVMKLDISGSPDDVLARFHSKWRYNIRLAERKGVTVQESTSRDDLKIFHDIYRVTAERDGFTGRPLKYFQHLWDVLVENDMARLFIAYYENRPLSAAISFILPPHCWYVYGASSNENRNVMPNHAMQWAMIRWAMDNGCTVYDFRGVHDIPKDKAAAPDAEDKEKAFPLMDSPDGLVRFKAGFGAELVEYVGEWDLPLHRQWYWLWTTARPRLVAALKNWKQRGNGK